MKFYRYIHLAFSILILLASACGQEVVRETQTIAHPPIILYNSHIETQKIIEDHEKGRINNIYDSTINIMDNVPNMIDDIISYFPTAITYMVESTIYNNDYSAYVHFVDTTIDKGILATNACDFFYYVMSKEWSELVHEVQAYYNSIR